MSDLLKTPRRWRQLTLRGLFVLMAFLAIGMSMAVRWHDRSVRQRRAVVALNADFFNNISYEGNFDPASDSSPVPSFLRGLLDFDHFYDVVDVDLNEANDTQMRQLKDFPALKSLRLSGPDCTDVGLVQIQPLGRLKTLHLLDVPALSDRGLETIGSMRGLEHVRLECTNRVTDKGIAHLAQLSSLKSLSLKCAAQVTDVGLVELAKLSNLEQLHMNLDDATNASTEFVAPSWLLINHDKPIRSQFITRLSELKHISSLSLQGNAVLTDEGLSRLRELPVLRTLRIGSYKGVTDRTLASLGELASLETLILDCGRGSETDAGLAALAGASELRRLEIHLGPAVSDAGLSNLCACPKLQRLKLHLNDQVSGEGLAGLKNLRYLELEFRMRGDDAPPFGMRLPMELEDLVLHGRAGLTEDDLAALAGLRNLRHLHLFWCDNLTDKGLEHLKRISQLEELWMFCCRQTTDGGIAGLRDSLPNCEIIVTSPSGGGSFGFQNRF